MNPNDDLERWKDRNPGSRTFKGPRDFRGYADFPGTGPSSERCGSCKHHVTLHKKGKAHHRCFLMARFWGKTDAIDIRQNSRACRHWEPSGAQR